MSAIKTVAGFAVLGAVLATGARSQRQFGLEEDGTVRPLIEQTVRMTAAGFNPQVALTMPELKDFSLGQVKVTRSKIGALIDSAFAGGDQNYNVYVRFREGGGDSCMTLSLEWDAKASRWKVSHPGAGDRCDPIW